MKPPLALLLLFLAAPARPAVAALRPPVLSQDGQVAAPAEWPKPQSKQKSRVKTGVAKLRKASSDKMLLAAEESLGELGALAARELIKAYAAEADEGARERLRLMLAQVTNAEHTLAWTTEFNHKSVRVRTLALKRVAAYPNASAREAAEAAFAAAEKARKPDAKERYAAALACASTGSFTGFELLFEKTLKHHRKHARELSVALTPLRGDAASERLLKRLSGTRDEKLATLRMLAACGSKVKVTSTVRRYLSDSDAALRTAAINALRAIIDGDPPLEKLSVFEAIERAKKWKDRLL